MSALQTNENNGTTESSCPTDTKRTFTVGADDSVRPREALSQTLVGAAISRPVGCGFVFRGRLIAAPTQGWRPMRRVCRLQQAFLLIRARSAHITCSLFTVHYSLFTDHFPLLAVHEKQAETGKPFPPASFFRIILESDKKVQNLFIAPEARQILHETPQRALSTM